MKFKKRVLIDVDDVVGQFRHAYLRAIHDLFGITITIEDTWHNYDVNNPVNLSDWQRNRLWNYINDPGWNLRMETMYGAREAIERISSKHEVSFVTKPLKSSPTWQFDRRRWIEKHFGRSLAKNLHFTGQKYAVDGNFLIEDNLSNCKDWIADRLNYSKRTCEAILFAWPYNEHNPAFFKRMGDWSDIADYICRED